MHGVGILRYIVGHISGNADSQNKKHSQLVNAMKYIFNKTPKSFKKLVSFKLDKKGNFFVIRKFKFSFCKSSSCNL